MSLLRSFAGLLWCSVAAHAYRKPAVDDLALHGRLHDDGNGAVKKAHAGAFSAAGAAVSSSAGLQQSGLEVPWWSHTDQDTGKLSLLEQLPDLSGRVHLGLNLSALQVAKRSSGGGVLPKPGSFVQAFSEQRLVGDFFASAIALSASVTAQGFAEHADTMLDVGARLAASAGLAGINILAPALKLLAVSVNPSALIAIAIFSVAYSKATADSGLTLDDVNAAVYRKLWYEKVKQSEDFSEDIKMPLAQMAEMFDMVRSEDPEQQKEDDSTRFTLNVALEQHVSLIAHRVFGGCFEESTFKQQWRARKGLPPDALTRHPVGGWDKEPEYRPLCQEFGFPPFRLKFELKDPERLHEKMKVNMMRWQKLMAFALLHINIVSDIGVLRPHYVPYAVKRGLQLVDLYDEMVWDFLHGIKYGWLRHPQKDAVPEAVDDKMLEEVIKASDNYKFAARDGFNKIREALKDKSMISAASGDEILQTVWDGLRQ